MAVRVKTARVTLGRALKRRRVATAAAAGARWETLCGSATELRLGCTVSNGQSFSWTQTEEEWIGCVGDAAFALRQHGASTQWRCISRDSPSSDDGLARLGSRLHRYFQLDYALAPRIARWGEADARCAAVASAIPGMRVMQQEPLECLISFICSSNNNIARITQMLRKLRAKYGRPIDLAPPYDAHELHTFPTTAELSVATVAELRALGFGYRARFVVESTAAVSSNGGEAWLFALRAKSRDEVQAALMTLCGVGRKVADCVALFALDQGESVLFTVTLCTNPANNLTCPPHILSFKTRPSRVRSRRHARLVHSVPRLRSVARAGEKPYAPRLRARRRLLSQPLRRRRGLGAFAALRRGAPALQGAAAAEVSGRDGGLSHR